MQGSVGIAEKPLIQLRFFERICVFTAFPELPRGDLTRRCRSAQDSALKSGTPDNRRNPLLCKQKHAIIQNYPGS